MNRNSDTRARLVEAAIDLIYGRSFGAVGVQEICNRADVRKGSFYHFFATKRDLALAALDELWRQLEEQVFAPAFAPDVPPLDRIERFFDYSARFQQAQAKVAGQVLGCPLGNIALEMSTQDDILRERVDQLFRAAERYIEQSLAQARDDGSAPELDPAAAARSIFAYMEGVLLMAKTRNDAETVRALGRSALALALGPAAKPTRGAA